MKMSSEICLCFEKLQVYENIEKKNKNIRVFEIYLKTFMLTGFIRVYCFL